MEKHMNLKAPLLLIPWGQEFFSPLKFEIKGKNKLMDQVSVDCGAKIFLLPESMSKSLQVFLEDEKRKIILYRNKEVKARFLPSDIVHASDTEIGWWLDMEKENIELDFQKSLRQPQIWYFGESSILKDFKLFFREDKVQYVDPIMIEMDSDIFNYYFYSARIINLGNNKEEIRISTVSHFKGLIFNQ